MAINPDGVHGDLQAHVALRCERNGTPSSEYKLLSEFPGNSSVYLDGARNVAVEVQNMRTEESAPEEAKTLLLALLAQR